MISKDKSFKFVQLFREIFKEEKDTDFKKSQACADLRKEFSAGKTGDEQFVRWFAIEFGLTAGQGAELLKRAVTFVAIKDETTWKKLGGYVAIRPLQDLPKKDQVSVIEVAKSTSKPVRTIMRERNLGQYKPENTNKPEPAKPIKPHEVRAISSDAKILAEFIRDNVDDLPKNIARIVERYVGQLKVAQKAA